MYKIAFFNIPAHGHINPTLPIVRELVERGHQVVYYSTKEFSEKVNTTGAMFHSYPTTVFTSKQISERMKSMIDASLALIEMSEAYTEWALNTLRDEKPDLIIYDSTAMWGYICARILGIPSICSITHFVLDGSRKHIPVGRLFRYFISAVPKLPSIVRWKYNMACKFGKQNVGGVTEYAPLNLVYTSKEFHPENSFIDDRFEFVGPSIDPTMRAFTEEITTSIDKPLVYISLGTINNLNTAFYRTAFRAFEDYPAQFILSVGQHTDIASLQPIPQNFSVYSHVPQLDVLQKSSVFITHGGMNSVHEGLFYGVPEIVIPQQMEQLLNGLRIAEVKAGILLGDKSLNGRVDASELKHTLDEILSNPIYQQNSRAYGKTLRDAGGYAEAVRTIENYLEQHSPISQIAV